MQSGGRYLPYCAGLRQYDQSTKPIDCFKDSSDSDVKQSAIMWNIPDTLPKRVSKGGESIALRIANKALTAVKSHLKVSNEFLCPGMADVGLAPDAVEHPECGLGPYILLVSLGGCLQGNDTPNSAPAQDLSPLSRTCATCDMNINQTLSDLLSRAMLEIRRGDYFVWPPGIQIENPDAIGEAEDYTLPGRMELRPCQAKPILIEQQPAAMMALVK
eukprot:scaffold107962_cov26-Prasinocladus_malaysianus.AAC.2